VLQYIADSCPLLQVGAARGQHVPDDRSVAPAGAGDGR
jgi:hypothetical protein